MPGPLRVAFAESTAADLLVSLAAVADPAWRDAFASAPADARLAGRALLRRAERFGRYPFVNLVGLLPQTRAPHSAAALLDALRRSPAPRLHADLLGARRRQLLDLVPADAVAGAAGGDAGARRALREAYASGRTVLGATRWLLAAPSEEVRGELLDLVAAWRDLRLPAAAERGLRATLAAEVAERSAAARGKDGVAVVADVAGGLTYDPPSEPRRVVLLPAPATRPIVLVVDDVAAHVVAYAPAVAPEPRDRLLDLARALGDATRLRILELLRDGERTAGDLAAAAGAPRTTLLHHLAMLRAAGLLTTAVGRGNATYYALRPAAVDELHSAAVTVLR